MVGLEVDKKDCKNMKCWHLWSVKVTLKKKSSFVCRMLVASVKDFYVFLAKGNMVPVHSNHTVILFEFFYILHT